MSEHQDTAATEESTARIRVRGRRVRADERAVRRVYDTPVWVPTQAQPHHDEVAAAPETPVVAEPALEPTLEFSVPDTAHWARVPRGRLALRLVLAGITGATGWAAYTAWATGGAQGVDLALLGVGGMVGVWVLLASIRPMTVDLAGSELHVRTGRTVDVFDLASPFQVLQLAGAVGSPSWSLTLERPDGTSVVLGSRTVRPAVLHPIVLHHQATARRLRAERAARFLR